MEPDDETYARNQILSLLHLVEFKDSDTGSNEDIPDLLGQIVDYACKQGIIEDIFDEKEIFSSKIMNCFMARPSTVNQIFFEKYKQHPKKQQSIFMS
jgi:UDPglucose--hexose-1-phosphate uridylyltransferase